VNLTELGQGCRFSGHLPGGLGVWADNSRCLGLMCPPRRPLADVQAANFDLHWVGPSGLTACYYLKARLDCALYSGLRAQ
jgi:hypothetical protein